jgi:hypothetical protein
MSHVMVDNTWPEPATEIANKNDFNENLGPGMG